MHHVGGVKVEAETACKEEENEGKDPFDDGTLVRS